MARPAKPRDTTVLNVRVANTDLPSIYAAAGGKERLSAWLRDLIRLGMSQAQRTGLAGPASDRDAGFQDGRRAGWHAANKVLREALTAAAEKLKTL